MLVEYKVSRLLEHIDKKLNIVEKLITHEIEKIIHQLKTINTQLSWFEKIKFKLFSIVPEKDHKWIENIRERLIEQKEININTTPLFSGFAEYCGRCWKFKNEEIYYGDLIRMRCRQNKLIEYRKIFINSDFPTVKLDDEEILFLGLHKNN